MNPLGQELSQLRSSLLFFFRSNCLQSKQTAKGFKIYEFGKVYRQLDNGYQEDKKIALALCGKANKEAWNTDTATNDIYRLKGAVYALLDSLGIDALTEEASDRDIFEYGICISSRKKAVVQLGSIASNLLKEFSIDQEVVYAEFDFDTLYQLAFKKDLIVSPIQNSFFSSRLCVISGPRCEL